MINESSSEEILKDIKSTLEEIKAILVLLNQDRLEEMKKRLLPEGSVKKQIYDLCDGTKTTTEMAQIIGKTESYVRSYLSILRRQGLVRSVKKDGKLLHEQIF